MVFAQPPPVSPASPQPRARRRRRTLVLALLGLLVVLLAGGGAWAWFAHTSTTATTKVIHVILDPPVDRGDQERAANLARRYMTALLQHDYPTMWSLLPRQKRTQWTDEKTYAHFWRLRFQHYILQSFTLGTVSQLQQWVDPETMTTYQHVLLLPVSLDLRPDRILLARANLPPEDRHPEQVYRNLPFIIQPEQTSDWQVLDGGPGDPEAPILPPLVAANASVRVPILMYHRIAPKPPTMNLLDISLTVTPAHFTQQLDFLKARGYRSITFNQLFDALYFNAPLPAHPVILTFDDGYEGVYQYALPILRAHGYSGMFYIITGFIGHNPDYMKWDQVRALLAAGMQIGSHTIDHQALGWWIIGAPQWAQRELQVSKATLERQLGIVIQQFCYPGGAPFRGGTLLEQQRIVAMLAADGYVGATSDPGATGTLQRSAAPFDLLRVRVDGRETLGEYAAWF